MTQKAPKYDLVRKFGRLGRLDGWRKSGFQFSSLLALTVLIWLTFSTSLYFFKKVKAQCGRKIFCEIDSTCSNNTKYYYTGIWERFQKIKWNQIRQFTNLTQYNKDTQKRSD